MVSMRRTPEDDIEVTFDGRDWEDRMYRHSANGFGTGDPTTGNRPASVAVAIRVVLRSAFRQELLAALTKFAASYRLIFECCRKAPSQRS